MRPTLALVFAMALAACMPFAAPTPTDSGIEGQVLIGPMCPVVREDEPCPDQPYQATLTIYNLAGRKVLQFTTDESGQFKIPLAPGQYVLHPESSNTLPYAEEQSFEVLAGQFTRIMVYYDSGIR